MFMNLFLTTWKLTEMENDYQRLNGIYLMKNENKIFL